MSRNDAAVRSIVSTHLIPKKRFRAVASFDARASQAHCQHGSMAYYTIVGLIASQTHVCAFTSPIDGDNVPVGGGNLN
jgi:hypothetical protein